MMYTKPSPNSFLLSSMLILSTLLILSAPNWLIMWLSMEINMFSIVPLMMNPQTNLKTESTIKYFLIQSVGSSILLLSPLLLNNTSMTLTIPFILTATILMKMGAAPFHFWLPPIMNNMSMNMVLIMLTWQKLAPILILSQVSYMWSYFSFTLLIGMNLMTGSLGGINQSSIRMLLTYSSISHTGWIITSMSISSSLLFLYFLCYSIITITITSNFNIQTKLMTTNFSMTNSKNSQTIIMTMINLLSLAGLPPLLGFFPKWLVIASAPPLTTMMLVLSSMISLFFYLSLFMASMTSTKLLNNLYLKSILPQITMTSLVPGLSLMYYMS